MNGKGCKGLILTKAAFESMDKTKIDPETLIVSTDSDWMAVATATPAIMELGNTEADAVAACRAWYDWKKYEKPFCCQMTLTTTGDSVDGDASVINASKTIAAESITISGTKLEFGALTFKSAQALATGVAIIASTIAMMN